MLNKSVVRLDQLPEVHFQLDDRIISLVKPDTPNCNIPDWHTDNK